MLFLHQLDYDISANPNLLNQKIIPFLYNNYLVGVIGILCLLIVPWLDMKDNKWEKI